MGAWEQEQKSLQDGGFSDDEIQQFEQKQRKDLFDAGFSGDEIEQHFTGVKPFNNSAVKGYFEKNLTDLNKPEVLAPALADPSTGSVAAAPSSAAPQPAKSFLEAVDAGFQMSVSGLLSRQKNPDLSVSEDAGMFYRIASQVGTLAGDIPAMVAGGIGGTAVGAELGPIGAVVAGGGGTFALPSAMRKILMDHYEKGDVKDFGDFWERASSTFIEAGKGFITGAATAGIGGLIAPIAGAPLTNAALKAASEVATMVTVGKGLEGKVPNPTDFLEAAIVVGGLHASTGIAGQLRSVYAETGILPSDAINAAQDNPVLKQELLSKNPDPTVINEQLTGEKAPPPVENVTPIEKALTPPGETVVGKTGEPAVNADGEPVVAPPASEPDKTVEPAPEPGTPESTIDSLISEKTPPEKEKYSFRKFYTDFVDRLDPVNQAVKSLDPKAKELAVAENPYSLARLANDYKAKVKHVFENGTLDYKTLAVNGEDFQSIVEPVKKDLQGLNRYLVSSRIVELDSRGIKAFKGNADALIAAKDVVAKYGEKFEEVSKNLVDFQNRNLKYLADSGRLTPELYSALVEANKSYIPFSRIIEPEPGSKIGSSDPLKKIQDGESNVQNPLVSVLDNTQAFFRMAEKNRATNALINLVEKTPDQTLFSPSESTRAVRDNEFEVWRDGERQVWQTEPEIAKAIKSLDGDQSAQNIFFKIANKLTLLKKLGTTFTPDFVIKNIFRDQLTAGAFSKVQGIPFVDTLFAMGDIMKKNDTYYNWLKAGGAGGSFLDLDTNYLSKDIIGLEEKTGFMSATWNIAKTPVALLRVAGSIAEEGTRLAEFKRVVGSETQGSKIFEGGFASREVTVDFQRIGAKMSAMNAITAFQNVSIQGLDRTIRAIDDARANPQALKTLAAGTSLITTASVLLWWNNHDQDWYKEINRWEKDLFWHIKAGETIFRLPKPQELGILFGSLPERVLEKYFGDNPKALADFGDTMLNLVTPAWLPDVLSAPAEHGLNHVFFTGNPVVNQSAEKLLPGRQYTDYTKESSKILGKLIGAVPFIRDIGPKDAKLASPLVVENYVRSWTGSLGMYTLQAADKALTATGVVPDLKPENKWSDIPFVKSFVTRYPSASSQSIKDFRDNFQQNEKVLNTIAIYGREGNLGEMQNVFYANQDKINSLKGMNDTITGIGHAIQLIYQNQELSKHDKGEKIDALYYWMISTAKAGNKLQADLEKTGILSK